MNSVFSENFVSFRPGQIDLSRDDQCERAFIKDSTLLLLKLLVAGSWSLGSAALFLARASTSLRWISRLESRT